MIVGIDSLIGSSLCRALEITGYKIFCTSRRLDSRYPYLDITDDVDRWPEFNDLDIIVICASLTKLQPCQENESLSYSINVEGVEKIILKYKFSKTKVIFLSSSHVFNGKNSFVEETEKVEPLNTYGLHKVLAENIILDNNGLIIRVTKVIDPNFPLFVDWISKLKSGKKIIAYNNLFASLIPLDSLIKTICAAIKHDWSGIVHLSGPEDRTYDEIARMLARKLKCNKELIISTTGNIEFSGMFKVYTTLNISSIIKDYNIYLPNTEKLLSDFVANKHSRIQAVFV